MFDPVLQRWEVTAAIAELGSADVEKLADFLGVAMPEILEVMNEPVFEDDEYRGPEGE